MQSTFRLAWGFVLCLLYFWRGWECTCVCMCEYARTHTHCTWGTRCEARGQDETPGGPEESRWTKSWHICIYVCVQSTYVYINAGRRDEIWTNCFFLSQIFGSKKAMQKMWTWKPRTRIEIESELHRPSIKGTKLLIVIKAIIDIIFIINTTCSNHLDC